MTDPQVAILMLTAFIFVIMLGFPICFTLVGMGMGFGYYYYFNAATFGTPGHGIFDNQIFDLLVNRTYSVISNDILTAVPMFLFMGYILERANIIDRLFFSLMAAARHLPAAMAVAALATCAIFSTATGIIGAVVTLMGLLAFPSMLKANYDTSFAAGVICAGGCLGILIPPSIMLLVYSVSASVSPVQLYAGAILPGFMLAGLYMLYVIGRATINPALAPKVNAEEAAEILGSNVIIALLTSFFPLAILILFVLGAILLGWATPTEAAATGCIGSLALAYGYKALTWDRLREAVYLCARTSAMVCWLFVGSWTFSSVFSLLGGHSVVEHFVLGMNLDPVAFLILAQVIIFLLGWPLEWSEIIIIFVPIFLPMLPHFGVDPLFFGILVALNLQTSFLTPPMAMAAYYLKGVSPPHVQLVEIFRGVMPYLVMVFIAMTILYNFPEIALYLPKIVYG
ncbi:MAG: TRAP transporter large permease subunit [Rhodospirillaceae bacterium]